MPLGRHAEVVQQLSHPQSGSMPHVGPMNSTPQLHSPSQPQLGRTSTPHPQKPPRSQPQVGSIYSTPQEHSPAHPQEGSMYSTPHEHSPIAQPHVGSIISMPQAGSSPHPHSPIAPHPQVGSMYSTPQLTSAQSQIGPQSTQDPPA